MARLPRFSPAGVPCHIVQRGNNRNICFVDEHDYQAYLGLMGEAAKEFGVAIHAWVLMTNHVHILATPGSEGGVSRMIQYIGSTYVRFFNSRYGRTGTLWEGRFKSCLVDDDMYYLICQRYIELNPVRAAMVEDPAQYLWSSYRVNALGEFDSSVTPHAVYLSLGATTQSRQCAYRELFNEVLDTEVVNELRLATKKSTVFGSERFVEEISFLREMARMRV